MSAKDTSGKLIPLEALRGMAALVVVVHHFVQCFLPGYDGTIMPYDADKALLGTPLFAFINGFGAVMLFFVLSGYVLSLKGFKPDAPRIIGEMALKRWLRLAPPVTLSVLAVWVFFTLGWQHYADAASFNHSDCLTFLMYSGMPQDARPGITDALAQGLYRTFLFGDHSFNPSIWTMRIEFYGSFFVFAIALTLRWPARRLLFIYLPLYAFLVWLNIFFLMLLPFLFGVIAAKATEKPRKLPAAPAFLLLALGLYLCGYYVPIGWYGWLRAVHLSPPGYRMPILSLGGLMLLIVFATENVISKRFHGRLSRLLGQASFPLYLVHALLLTSPAAWAYAHFEGGAAGVTAALVTFIISALPAVWLLVLFESWWLGRLQSWRPFTRRGEKIYG